MSLLMGLRTGGRPEFLLFSPDQIQTSRVKRKAETRWIQVCGNPACKGHWLQTWRSRHAPLIENSWTCSSKCTQVLISRVLSREIGDFNAAISPYEPGMPLGLVLLAKRWITPSQLKGALAKQRQAGHGSVGEWLKNLYGVSEDVIARGLAAQWSCTYLRSDTPGLEALSPPIPPSLAARLQLNLVTHA